MVAVEEEEGRNMQQKTEGQFYGLSDIQQFLASTRGRIEAGPRTDLPTHIFPHLQPFNPILQHQHHHQQQQQQLAVPYEDQLLHFSLPPPLSHPRPHPCPHPHPPHDLHLPSLQLPLPTQNTHRSYASSSRRSNSGSTSTTSSSSSGDGDKHPSETKETEDVSLSPGKALVLNNQEQQNKKKKLNGELMMMMKKKKKKKNISSPLACSEELLARFTTQVIEQQELLYEKFMERVEKLERERSIREEEYRRHEIGRSKREQELRMQEQALVAKRDATLLSFLHKVTGQTLHLPTLATTVTTPTLDVNHLYPYPHPASTNINHSGNEIERESSDSSTRRWPKMEVHALIRIRSGMEARFQEGGPKARLWEEISTSMACLGFNRSAKRCKEKWENINKYFRKTKDSCRKRPENAKTCPYFHHLEMLYDRGVLPLPTTTTSSNKHAASKPNDHNMQLLENGLGEETQFLQAKPCGDGVETQFLQANPCGDGVAKRLAVLSEASTSSRRVNMPALNTKPNHVSSKMMKNILEMQHEQQILEEYQRLEQEQAQEMREQEIIRMAEHEHLHGGDNATLMALVHKLAGAASASASAPSQD